MSTSRRHGLLLSPTLPLLAAVTANALLLGPLWAGFFPFVRRAYDVDTLVLPALLAVVGVANAATGRRRPAGACLALAGALVGLRFYATHVEPRRLVLREERVETPKVAGPLRILHISDVQSDAVGPYEEWAFERMARLEPDVVFHTGDLLQPLPPATIASEVPKLRALVASLHPPGGVWGVYGDMALATDGTREDEAVGLRMLEGTEATLPVRGATLRVLGLSRRQSRGLDGMRAAVEGWLARAAPTDVTVLLGHAPDYVLDVQDLPIDLCLAGHTHGGQIVIPGLGPPVTLSRVPRALVRGLHAVGRTRLNVSAGVGSEHVAGVPAIRFLCPTEMSLLTLVPPGGGS